MNRRDVEHEIFVIGVSYFFVFAGAWNDGLLGFAPSPWSRGAEYTMALLLASEIAMRLAYTERKPPIFWTLVAFDVISVLTVVPALDWVTFARFVRMFYAAGRLTMLLDRIAARRNNGMYVTAIFPFVVPLLAAAVFAVERHAPGTPVHNYLDALRICFSFSLSLGNVRPVTSAAMAICGVLFIIGLVTIGVLTNTISSRYQDP
jgi:hypothetical protein